MRRGSLVIVILIHHRIVEIHVFEVVHVITELDEHDDPDDCQDDRRDDQTDPHPTFATCPVPIKDDGKNK